MVLRETQGGFVYFSVHGLTVDGIIVNRVVSQAIKDEWFEEWRASEAKVLQEIDEYFSPVAVKRVPLFTHEVLGRERLEELAHVLYEEKEDPAAVLRAEAPYIFVKRKWHYAVQLEPHF